MRSTLANLWHLVRGIETLDIGEKRFLFRHFHWMDLDQVLKRVPWTFNNHLLVFYRLLKGNIPLKVPLVTVYMRSHQDFFHEKVYHEAKLFHENLGKFGCASTP